ncbi:GntR family transcriptional regulator [Stenotrophomonas sp. HITSZ_GD]|uniref:GntR family transcriptional regulator n=1 Tax=Stenotrophomonas sp. HITSZ_GD TaxID=3037248 RepID=UPI00240D37B3|nr:GntR family transcriptional regulator [Stenotrophomonas sp. HITSZ_GD]MDG2525898.1 GntR family transcriptional regulator [Stenotrophomonas sp. HITSZ_GD]
MSSKRAVTEGTQWRRIAAILATEIRQGYWRDGRPLPAALRLAERFGVHRHTVRKSLDWLRAEGLLRAHGRRVAAPRLPLPLAACTFLPEHLHDLGVQARSTLRACTTVAGLPPALQARTPCHLPGPLLHLVYDVAGGEQLWARTEAWLPAGAFTDVGARMVRGHALGTALRQAGIAAASRRHAWVEAGGELPDALADLADASLSLRVCVLALDARGLPLKLCLHHFDAGRLRLLV